MPRYGVDTWNEQGCPLVAIQYKLEYVFEVLHYTIDSRLGAVNLQAGVNAFTKLFLIKMFSFQTRALYLFKAFERFSTCNISFA